MVALIVPWSPPLARVAPRVPGVTVYYYDGGRHWFAGQDSSPSESVWVWAFKRGEARRYLARFPGIDHRLPAGDHLLVGKRHRSPLLVRDWRAYLARFLFQVIKSRNVSPTQRVREAPFQAQPAWPPG